MRKTPRLVASLVVLGLFAVVGVLTFSAFAASGKATAAPMGSTEARTEAKASNWDEVRNVSVVKP